MKTITFIAVVTLVAAALRVLIFGWPEQVHFDDRTSPLGDIEYTCMFTSEQDFIDVKYQEVHYHDDAEEKQH